MQAMVTRYRSWVVRSAAAMLVAVMVVGVFPAVRPAQAQVLTLATVVNTDGLNVRSGPGIQHPVVRGLARGAQIGLVGRSADGAWVQLQASGPEWVDARFVQPFNSYDLMNLPVTGGGPPDPGGEAAPAPPAASGVWATVVNTNRLNVRSGPSVQFRATRGLTFGQQVVLVGRNANGTWVQLQTSGGLQEWVNANYVRAFDNYNILNLPVTSNTTPDTPPASATAITAVVVNANRLNVRSGPGENFGVVRQVPGGQSVVLVGRNANGTWVQLQAAGQEWVFSRLVQPQANENLMSLPVTSNTYGTPSTGPTTGVRIHTVQAGETLSSIARRYGTTVQVLVALNGLANPNHVYVGQRLNVGGAASSPPSQAPSVRYHTVRQGETLASIARAYGTSWQALAALNGISNPNQIYAGQQLRVQ